MTTDQEQLRAKQEEELRYKWGRYNVLKFLWHTLLNLKIHYRFWRQARRDYGRSYIKYWEFSKSWRGFRLMLTDSYENEFFQFGFSPGWGAIWLTLPFSVKWLRDDRQYGVYYHEATIWFCWGKRNLTIDMPWQYTWVRTSYLMQDDTWHHELGKLHINSWEEPFKSRRWQAIYPYTYTLKCGEVQHANATVMVSERESRMRGLLWLQRPWLARVSRSIDIEFDQGVGEGKYHYKGGVISTGYELRPSETPEQCLRRMEKERRFDR